MTEDLHAATQQMLDEIQKKDRRFRTAQAIFMFLVVVGLAAALIFEAILLTQVKNQATEIQKNTQAQLDKQSHYIECIAKFFASKDRQNLTLNIQSCQVNKAADAPVASATQSNAVPAQSNQTQQTPLDQNKNPNTNSQNSQPNSGQGGNPSPQSGVLDRIINSVKGLL